MFSQSHLERLGDLGSLHIYDRDDYDDRKYILDFIKDSELIVTAWGSSKLDDEMVELCPNLRAVIHAGGAVKQLLSDTIIKNNITLILKKCLSNLCSDKNRYQTLIALFRI